MTNYTRDIPDTGGQARDFKIRLGKISSLATADDKVLLTEPSTNTDPNFYWIKKEVSLSGHTKEVDDTPGAERLMEMHKSGTYQEIQPDGTKVTKVFGDNWEVSIQDKVVVVSGDMTIVVQGDSTVLCNGNVKHKVHGDYELTIQGNMKTVVQGNIVEHAGGNIHTESLGSIETKSKDEVRIEAVSNIRLDTKESLYTASSNATYMHGGNNFYIDAERIDWNYGMSPNRITINYQIQDYGLGKPDSITEPSSDHMSMNRFDSGFYSMINTNIKYPKDRSIIKI